MEARAQKPWWLIEFDRLRGGLIAHLNRRGEDHGTLAEDHVAQTQEEVAAIVSKAASPSGWRPMTESPTEEEARRFRALVWTILKRRFVDSVRHRYVERELLPHLATNYGLANMDAQVQARQLLGRLATLVDNLPERDRELLMLGASQRDGALTGAERVRLLRLRAKLRMDLGLGQED